MINEYNVKIMVSTTHLCQLKSTFSFLNSALLLITGFLKLKEQKEEVL